MSCVRNIQDVTLNQEHYYNKKLTSFIKKQA